MAAETALRGGRRAATPRPRMRGSSGLSPSAEDRLRALGGASHAHWPRRLLVTANAIVLVMLLLGASAYGYVEWRLGQVDRVRVAGLVPAASGPLTILAVGSDTRNLGKGASAAFGNAQEVTGQRSDTIILVRVVPATASVALLSIPRDLLVPVPGLGTTRINAAFDSGPNLLVQVIEQDLGVQVNHFMVVNFYTFTEIADSLGGVYQYFPTPARDLWSGLSVPHAGCFLLKGSEALGFVRSREYQYYLDGSWHYQLVPESDLGRIQRQQDFIKLAIRKAEHIAPTNPLALNRVLAGITGSLTVDSSFSNSLMLRLAIALRHVHATGIPNWTYPTVNSTAVPGALDPVPSLDQQMVRQFLSYGLPATAPRTTTTARVNPSQTWVKVLNGSGTNGQAASAAAALKAAGYKISGTGNAKSFTYATSIVQYGAGELARAKTLAVKIGGGASLDEVSSLSPGHLVLITGASFSALLGTSAGAQAAGSPPATTASTAPTNAPPVAPDSSSYYHGQYVPPGLQPGQVPETCPI